MAIDLITGDHINVFFLYMEMYGCFARLEKAGCNKKVTNFTW